MSSYVMGSLAGQDGYTPEDEAATMPETYVNPVADRPDAQHRRFARHAAPARHRKFSDRARYRQL
jgi:hypothetical protein